MSQFDEAVRGDGINIAYIKKLTKALNNQRNENQLCDIVINVAGRLFNAHRGVLAASSSFFKAMFTSGFTETNQNEISVAVDGKPEHFEMILDYMYTGKLDVYSSTKPDDICAILQIANYLQVTEIVSTCTSFIKELYEDFTLHQMPIRVAYQYLMVAKANDLVDLVESSQRYLQDNVAAIKDCEVFLKDASVEFMQEFLAGENLATADEEEEVLSLVLRWLKFDWDTRSPYTYQLLQMVRLGLVPEDRCNELLDESVLEVPECKDLLDKALQLQRGMHSEWDQAKQNPELFATRSTVTAPVSVETKKLSMFSHSTYFRCYDAKSQAWEKMTCEETFTPISFNDNPRSNDRFFPECYQFHALLSTDEKLYMAGGKTPGGEANQEFFCYNPETDQWSRLPIMLSARYRFPLVRVDEWIYAIGGSLPGRQIRSVERFNTDEGRKWESVTSISAGRKPFEQLTAIEHHNTLLVYGISTSCPKGVEGHRRNGNCSCDSNAKFQLILKTYYDVANKWQILLTEEHFCNSTLCMRPPSLLVHKDVCYRIMHHHAPAENDVLHQLTRPVVNVLDCKFKGYKVTVTIGDDIKQDYIPDNRAFAFRIHDEVFATKAESVFNTGIKIADDQSGDVDLSNVEAAVRCGGTLWEGISSGVVTLTFDKRIMRGELELE